MTEPQPPMRGHVTDARHEGPVVLRLPDGSSVARYDDGADLDPFLAPRPFLHPVRTRAGHVVTAIRPDDHPWHLGVSMAVPDVDGTNLWGGPSFVADRGYVDLDDRGTIEHLDWIDRHPAGFTQRLQWRAHDGVALLEERRTVHCELPGTGDPDGRTWRLRFRSVLTAPSSRSIALRSPETNGRPGAGYGGFFWRSSFTDPQVVTASGGDEQAAHGGHDDWVALVGNVEGGRTPCTLVFSRVQGEDPWFVRASEYPAIGTSLARRRPLVIPAGTGVARAVDVLVADGALATEEMRSLTAATG